jgi:hypothetical protein
MSLKKSAYYKVICNVCRKPLMDDEDVCLFSTQKDAIQGMRDQLWEHSKREDICPDCLVQRKP